MCSSEPLADECSRMINSFGDAMWWAIVTTTTVGYGDYSPVDPLSRVVAAFLMKAYGLSSAEAVSFV